VFGSRRFESELSTSASFGKGISLAFESAKGSAALDLMGVLLDGGERHGERGGGDGGLDRVTSLYNKYLIDHI
jgi:hypothetical protein